MTGLHAIHMIIGLGIMAVMLWWAWRGIITPELSSRSRSAGSTALRGHVWIFLFPLLYLIGRHVH